MKGLSRLLVVGLAVAASSVALGYKVNRTQYGAEVHWSPYDLPVLYRLQATGSADVTDGSDLAALDTSFRTWEDVSCTSLRFEKGPSYTSPPVISGTDGINLLMWIESSWPSDVGPEAIGVTTAFHSVATGEITDADIWFNGVHFSWATDGRASAVDVANIATHEMGHFFGLGHSEYSDATMYYASAGDGELVRRSLSSDDQAAVCYLYPTDCANTSDCTPPETCERGRCVPPPPPPAGVGEPCTGDQSCQTGTGNNTALCLTQDTYDYPGGYCIILDCSAEAPCPDGGVCEQLGTASDGSPVNACMDACRPSAPDCREGYFCLSTGDDLGFCYPRCYDDSECGEYACDETTGACAYPGDDTAQVGDPCQAHTQCPTGGACAQEAQTGFPDGYCYRVCGPGRPCPTGTSCYTIDETTAVCFLDCPVGSLDFCRTDYACSPMGSGATGGACLPACRSNLECGDGLVCDDESGLCVEPPPPPTDGGTEPDAGTPPQDAGTDSPDGGTGSGGAPDAGGCGCSAGGGGSGPWAGFFALLTLLWRRRSRR